MSLVTLEETQNAPYQVERETSPAYVATVGPHVLGAHLSGSGLSLVHDTTVNLDAGEAFTRHVVSITPEC